MRCTLTGPRIEISHDGRRVYNDRGELMLDLPISHDARVGKEERKAILDFADPVVRNRPTLQSKDEAWAELKAWLLVLAFALVFSLGLIIGGMAAR